MSRKSWALQRAEGVILAYVRDKKRATLNWAGRSLWADIAYGRLSEQEVRSKIGDIETGPFLPTVPTETKEARLQELVEFLERLKRGNPS